MPFAVIQTQCQQISHLILHHNGQSGTALTIDCPTLDFLNEIYGLFSAMDGQAIYNHDEGKGAQFHAQLHNDMMAAMATTLVGTMTPFHQHWVDSANKGTLLSFGHARQILLAFKKKNWVTQANIGQAFAAAYT
jgi:hypothetical protein